MKNPNWKPKQLTAFLPISQSDVLILDSLLVVATTTMAKRSLMSTKIVNLIYIACFAFCQTTNFVISVCGVLGPQVFLRISCKLCRVRLASNSTCMSKVHKASYDSKSDSNSDSDSMSSISSISATSRINWHLWNETLHSTPLHTPRYSTWCDVCRCTWYCDTVQQTRFNVATIYGGTTHCQNAVAVAFVFAHGNTLHVARCTLQTETRYPHFGHAAHSTLWHELRIWSRIERMCDCLP